MSFFAIPDAVRLDNPKLMLWRELQQHGDEALQKSNRPKDHNSRMRFWRVWLNIREIQVQCHQHAIFRAATLGEHRIAGTREFLVGGRIRFETRPRIDVYSVGRFSSALDFKL